MNERLRQLRGLLVILMLLIAAGSERALAQEDLSPKRGIIPGGSYAVGDIETIDTTNGNLFLRIPLAQLAPGRAGEPGLGVSLVYNSKLWNNVFSKENLQVSPYSAYVTTLSPSKQGNWSLSYQYEPDFIDWYADQGFDFTSCSDPAANHRNKVMMTYPDGSRHEFRPYGYVDSQVAGFYNVRADGYLENCGGLRQRLNLAPSNTLPYYSIDGTYTRLDFEQDSDGNNMKDNPWTLYFPDGRRVKQTTTQQEIYDRNGNMTTIGKTTTQGRVLTTITDSVGRQIIIDSESGSEFVSLKQSASSQDAVQTWILDRSSICVRRSYIRKTNTDPSIDVNGTVVQGFNVYTKITLPNSQTYTFEYNAGPKPLTDQELQSYYSVGFGELSKITTPSQAKAIYTYDKSGWGNPYFYNVLDNAVLQKDMKYVPDATSPEVKESWQYAFQGTSTAITAPDGGVVTDYYVSPNMQNDWSRGLVYKSVRSDRIIERLWQRNIPNYNGTSKSLNGATNNPYVKTEFISLKDQTGTPTKTGIRDYNYDRNGNVTRIAEYDWVAYSSVPRDGNGKPTGAIPAGAVLKRETVNTFYNPTLDASTNSDSASAYFNPLSPQLKNAINLKDIKFNSSTVAKTEYSYDNYSTAGNLTQERRWDPQTLTWATTVNHSYDSYGNRTLTTNARGYQTTFGYGNVCGITGLYVTDITLASNATTDLQRKSHLDYDCNFGLVTTETDVDNGIIASTSYDVFGRPTLVVEAQGISGEQRQTTTTYDDQNRKITIRSDLKTYQDGSLVTETSYDPLGRVYLARRLESPSDSSGIKTDSRSIFSGTNSYRVVSNPYRTTSDLTAGWTRSKMDQSGRVLEVETFSGAAYPAPWGSNTNTTGKVVTNYNADVTTVTDQANKKRSSTKDGLGRLIKVTEDPSGTPLDTLYSYDVLDNLTSVTQVSQTPPATQTRTFLYNSLSQLTSATNPESGTISYTYDPNGNLLTKADARPKTITYTYDPLDRLSTKSYSDSTPAVTYGYGAPSPGTSCGTFSVGKVCSVSTSVAATNFSNYNSKGQATQSSQTINAITTTYPFSYTYGLSGRMTSQTYPSTVTVVNTVEDEAGRIAGVSNGDGSLYYAGASYSDLTNRIQYSPAGAMVQMRLGNGLWNDTRFNSRLQAIQIGLGQTRLTNLESTITPSSTVADKLLLDLCFSGTDTNCSNGVTTNNGNLSRQRLRKQSTPGLDLSQSYTYDALNRITSAGETPVTGTVWPAITYGLDRYGNRWVSAGYNPGGTLTPISQSEFNAANNRMVSPSGYDAVGNQTTNKVSQTATYDAESRMTSFNSGAGITNYAYDGEGRRVSKQLSSGATTYYVYNTLGQLSAEYLTTGPVGGGITYLTWDHLGSTRVTTDAAKAFKTCHDYLPYGEEIDPSYGGRAGFPCYTSTLLDGPNQKFTAKERDTESKLDYFLARYYSGAQGRFTSVDPENSGAVPDDPQSWNAYAYARNNPLYYIDPTGEAYNYCPSESDSCYEVADEDFKKFQEDNKGKLIFEGTNIYTVNEDGTKGSLYATYDYALPQGTAQVASQVVEHAGPAVNFFYTLTMAFLFNAGPGILADSYSMPQLATSIGRALIANGTKAGAREVIERTAMSQAQKAAAKRAVARATTRETISVDRLADGSLRIMKQRPGGDGYQVIQTIVRPDGGSSTVQMGVTAAGKLTHYDPK